MPEEEIPLELVRRTLARMEADALPEDEDAWRVIRKYRRLLKNEEARRSADD